MNNMGQTTVKLDNRGLESFGQVAATVNFGSPVTDTQKIANVNGIVPRYQAYANALNALADLMWFPAAVSGGTPQDFPDK